MLAKLNDISDVSIPSDGIDRRPSFPLVNLDSDKKINAFFAVFEWFISEVQDQ